MCSQCKASQTIEAALMKMPVVFQSVLSVWEVVKELRQLMKDIPMYSSHFMSILNEVLMGYRDSLRLLYKGCLLLFHVW